MAAPNKNVKDNEPIDKRHQAIPVRQIRPPAEPHEIGKAIPKLADRERLNIQVRAPHTGHSLNTIRDVFSIVTIDGGEVLLDKTESYTMVLWRSRLACNNQHISVFGPFRESIVERRLEDVQWGPLGKDDLADPGTLSAAQDIDR